MLLDGGSVCDAVHKSSNLAVSDAADTTSNLAVSDAADTTYMFRK